jgi:integrase
MEEQKTPRTTRRRRGSGEGSIYQRSDGRWVASISLRGMKRKTLYGKTRREVQSLLQQALNEKQQGMLASNPGQTLKQYLKYWLDEIHKASIRPRTYERYEELIRLHVLPTLGFLSLQTLKPQHIQALLATKLTEGFAPKTVSCVYGVLHTALKDAVRWGLLVRNVCDLVTAPRKQYVEVHPLTPLQIHRLLEAAKEHRYAALFTLALATGMRQGEILGLKWQDVQLAEGTLQVRRTQSRVPRHLGKGYVEAETKTRKSRRSILLADFALEALKVHQLRQQEIRTKAGAKWQERDLVFCTTKGTPLNPSRLRDALHQLLEEARLPHIRFHDLRHSTATFLLSLAVHPKVVQEILGHSQISMTLDIYSHVLPTMQKEAMERLSKALQEQKDDASEKEGNTTQKVQEDLDQKHQEPDA